jgi:hypothetical protein
VASRKVEIVLEAFRRAKEWQDLMEGLTPFLIYRADTGVVLARGINGYEAAKEKATALRKAHGLKWDMVKFRADRGAKSSSASTYGRSVPRGRMDVARNYNPSKRGRFRGYYDSQGNFHDLD